jgi:hypothetical protein
MGSKAPAWQIDLRAGPVRPSQEVGDEPSPPLIGSLVISPNPRNSGSVSVGTLEIALSDRNRCGSRSRSQPRICGGAGLHQNSCSTNVAAPETGAHSGRRGSASIAGWEPAPARTVCPHFIAETSPTSPRFRGWHAIHAFVMMEFRPSYLHSRAKTIASSELYTQP